MVSEKRVGRIEERIREELSVIILIESGDPRLKGVTITSVDIDRELDYAEIYVSTIDGSGRSQEVLNGLAHAQGFLRSELAHRIKLRSFPQLRFHWDSTFEHADKIERLLSTIRIDEEQKKKKTKRGEKTDGSQS